METFDVTILGCGSATPSPKHYTSSQIVNIREKLFMIDCGEGTQIQMRRSKVSFGKLNHILISHLHGDHCFGLLGIISSFGMLGRKAPLFVHAPFELWKILKLELDFYCSELEFEICFQGFNPNISEIIYDDKSLSISTIPLIHKIPCSGFLFTEKATTDHLDRAAADFYEVPIWDYNRIKEGGDFITKDGILIPHCKLTKPAGSPRKYAYCCDTEYNVNMTPQIYGSDMMYHDCTYCTEDITRARLHHHSTAAEAAKIALDSKIGKLILGHFSAKYVNENILLDEAKEIFKNSFLAKENLVFSI